MSSDVYCPVCRKLLSDDENNIPVFQPDEITLYDWTTDELSIPEMVVEARERYCCPSCHTCFIIER